MARTKKTEPIVTEKLPVQDVPQEVVAEEAQEPVVEPKEELPKNVFVEAPDRRIYWKKIGKGSLHIGRRIIKPGEKFLATPDEIPQAFRDVIIPLEDIVEVSTEENVVVKTMTYQKQANKENAELWDVVNEEGKIINETGLSLDQVTRFLKALNS
jgi:hypothetical protein